MTTLNIGNITIDNPQLANNIKAYSVDDIKKLFVEFLNQEITALPKQSKPQSKWGEFAQKMQGSFSPEMIQHLKRGREEARENFTPRSKTQK